MQLLARYLGMTFFKNLMLALLGLTGLFFFQNIITQLNEYRFYQMLVYSMYDIPSMMVVVSPPATLIATVLTFSMLSKSNELIAFHSIGISLAQMLGVLLPIVFVVCCLSLVAQDRISLAQMLGVLCRSFSWSAAFRSWRKIESCPYFTRKKVSITGTRS